MKSILVSGSNGFVGRHFVRRFLNAGHEVVGIDNLSAGLPHEQWRFKPNSFSNFKFLNADVRDVFRANSWKPDRFDLVVHCAAIVGGRLKIDGDPLAVATDLSVDSEMFHWIVRSKRLPQVVYFSSSAIYPLANQTRDNHCELYEGLQNPKQAYIGRPDQTYGFVKLAGETLAQFAHEQYGLDVKVYRPFGGYGEDQSFDYPFPSIIRRIVNGENPVVVWGSGDQQRDFIHIDDIVSAVVTTLPNLPACESLNLGTGRALSFKELARIAADQLGVKVRIINDASKPEGVFSRVAGTQKLFKLWQPTISVEEGIRRVTKAMTERLTAAE